MDLSKKLQLNTEETADRISQLPECLLNHIFKFLPVTNVVQSCVLSKRWRDVWTSVQHLAFTRCGFSPSINFGHFVDAVLAHRQPLNIDTFRLDGLEECDLDQLNTWIIYAVNHKVRELDLNIALATYEYELPTDLLTCQSLVTLWISGENLCISGLTSLNSLKRLYMEYLELTNEDLKNLISGCPMIEDLYMDFCEIGPNRRTLKDNYSKIDICSQTMKNMMLEYCSFECVRFCTPNLHILKYESDIITGASFTDMPYLESAMVSDKDGSSGIIMDGADFIRPFSNAKRLKLFGQWMELISEKDLSKFPTFGNLEYLMVDRCCMSNFQAVANFLQHAPNLERLVLVSAVIADRVIDRECGCHLQTARKIVNLSFNCPNLKLIEIQCASGKEGVPDLVNILLQNSTSSPVIQIISDTLPGLMASPLPRISHMSVGSTDFNF